VDRPAEPIHRPAKPIHGGGLPLPPRCCRGGPPPRPARPDPPRCRWGGPPPLPARPDPPPCRWAGPAPRLTRPDPPHALNDEGRGHAGGGRPRRIRPCHAEDRGPTTPSTQGRCAGGSTPCCERERGKRGRGRWWNEGSTKDLGLCLFYTLFQLLGSYGPRLGLIY